MMSVLLLLVVLAASLGGLMFWWIRRNNLAVYPAGRGPLVRQPLPIGCELGVQLMAASSVDTAPASGVEPKADLAPSPKPPAPKRTKPSGPSRREFLRNAWLAAWGGVAAAWGAAMIAYLWPNLRGGFGGQVTVGSVDDIKQGIKDGNGQMDYPASRMHIVPYDPALDTKGQYKTITNGAPFMALYQRCVHLGCRVPWCATSQWFECPCHGSRYNQWGEYQFGPAPRGLDRFSVKTEGDKVVVDTSTIITGPARRTGSLDQPPAGPHCN
jgi:cytochrome b6-f complex iron-sulfur subunit